MHKIKYTSAFIVHFDFFVFNILLKHECVLFLYFSKIIQTCLHQVVMQVLTILMHKILMYKIYTLYK